MKAVVAALLIAASPLTPPPLIPLGEAPVEDVVPHVAPWWVWAIWGTATAQVLGTLLFLAYGLMPLFNPGPIPSGQR